MECISYDSNSMLSKAVQMVAFSKKTKLLATHEAFQYFLLLKLSEKRTLKRLHNNLFQILKLETPFLSSWKIAMMGSRPE